MKKRVLAVVLCLAMLIGYVPYFAFTAQASNSLNIYQDGVLATSAPLPKNQSVKLEAFVTNGSQYQWQILIYGDNWVNITGGAGSTLKVTYAMIASLCNGGAATLRVKALSDGAEVTSGNFTVYVTDPVIEPSQENSEEEKYVVQDAPDAIIHDTPVSETTAPTQAPTETPTEAATEAPTEAPTQAPTESTAAADLAAAEAACAEAAAAYDQAAAAYDLAAADLAAKQTAYEAAAAKRAEAEAAVQASAVVTTIPAEVTTNENGETVEVTPESTSVSYDAALVAAANAAAAEEAAALEARNAAQDALTQAEANKAAAEANKAAAEAALNAAQAAAAAAATQPTETQPTETQPAVTQPAETTPVTKAPSFNFTFRGSSNYALPNNDSSTQAEDETTATTATTPSTYPVVINYVFADNRIAAQSFVASLAAGSDYSKIVTHPTVQGYLPYVNGERSDKIELNISNIQQEHTYTVIYKPDIVPFKVEHYMQNVDNDQYTLAQTDKTSGYTDNPVGERLNKEYTGFYSLLYDTGTKIAADGSTVVKIYYDRYYYLMTFDLDGGYGVEPIYARYGTSIGDVGTPEKAGYSFNGWDKEIPSTMPAKSTSIKALWQVGGANLTVVFWYENANDDGYSVAGSIEVTDKKSGDTVTSADYQKTAFTDRDDEHFTYNANMAEEKTVAGDGGTVLNVYYTRNTYTITFPGVGERSDTLQCGLVEHQHSNVCCRYGGTSMFHWGHSDSCCKLGLIEHSHSDDCYTTYTVTQKYDSDISRVWETDPIKSLLNKGYVFQSSLTQKYYSFLEKMPGQDITMTKTRWSGDTYTWYYYLEVPKGMSAPNGAETTTDGGKTYYLYHTTSTNGDGIYLTYDEDYFPITGYTQRDKKGENGWNLNGGVYRHNFDIDRTYKLFYTRNQYELKFINYGTPVSEHGGMYYYEQDISGTDFTPDYPEKLEVGGYAFDGWYDNPFFNESGRFDFENATMPAGPVILYAHWVPVTHNVNIYSTSAMTEDQKIGETQIVSHRDTAVEPAEPTHPTSDKYEFVGWFYMTDDTTPVEKAFDFSMPITRDMNIYAKWSSNVMVGYTIYYQLEDGTTIAEPTKGQNLAGTTKTFEAKTDEALYENYRTGYFPVTSSHNLPMNIEQENKFIFVYVPMDKVPYTVKYLEKDTQKVLKEEKHAETSNAVITEKFEFIKGYAPDAYQKRLVLSATESENVIIFWYAQDDKHAPVQRIHWIQNIEGDGYTEYQSSTDLNGVIGTKYDETPLSIDGFRYNGTKSNASGTLPGEGLVLNLYYDRILYPYEFKFLEQGTDKVLATSVTATARYQAQVTQKALTIPGYKLTSDEHQAINIAIENPENIAKNNVRIFYYQEDTVDIYYQIVGPDGCGTLDNSKDLTVKIFTGTPAGSQATASDTYRFVGWYEDEACTKAVNADWVVNGKITPQKSTVYNLAEDITQMGYKGAIYYAKFELGVADLTITKQVDSSKDENQSFIFNVVGDNGISMKVVIQGSGSVTIKNLPIATYTVTEDQTWSWRYKATSGSGTSIKLGADTNEVIITNNRDKIYWLSGDSYSENRFNYNTPKDDKE